jgi:hypothetical protein
MSFARLSKREAQIALTALVNKYATQRHELEKTDSKYTETETRGEFIDPFLEIFGWDVHNAAGNRQSQRQVILEHAKDETADVIGRPDYRLRVRGRDRLPVEAKKPSVNLATSAKSSQQARSYGFSLALPAAVLTNFAQTVIFDARIEPVEGDHEDVGVIPGLRVNVDEYVAKFETLWDYLAFENVSDDTMFNGQHHYEAPPRGTSPFDKTFLRYFREWRLTLAQEISTQNTSLGGAEVGRRTQRLLNALLFIRVCEDRDIWQYEQLMKSAITETVVASFAQADHVFNAGLFTVLRDTNVRPTVLREVIAEMYWPLTKFAFGVMQPDVLADVYEQYLAERVEIATDRTVVLVEKPELTHSGGVIPTPQFIVDALVEYGFDGALTVPGMIPRGLAVVDPACGSGVFLLAAFKRLLDQVERTNDSTLEVRGALAKAHIFGVDLDGEAVEVSRLSLLMAVLGESHVDPRSDNNVLPDLSMNIKSGNAVVGDDFDACFPLVASDPSRRAAVAPASWTTLFPDVMARGGFDILLANPPYVRIQTMQEFLPDHLAYFQNSTSGYGSAEAFNFDLYMIFVERALTLLTDTGRLAMIIPNRFTNGLAGTTIRELLGRRLELLVHFGEIQIFPGRLTYTALIVAGPVTKTDAIFELVSDLERWKAGKNNRDPVERTRLTAAPWPIATSAQTELFDRMLTVSISRLADWVEIFVGVQTSADDIFFVKPDSVQSDPLLLTFSDKKGRSWSIERAILRPSLKKRRLRPYDSKPVADGMAIFPYAIEPPLGKRKKARAVVFDATTMSMLFPKSLAYLTAHRKELAQRNVSPDPGAAFWAYGRSQSLTKLEEPKIILRTLSLVPQYASDPDSLLVPGGGDGGPYTLLRVREKCPYPESVMIGILSHPAVDAFVASRGKAYQGSYVVHRKAFLAEIPIPQLSVDDIKEIGDSVAELQQITRRFRTETDSAVIASLSRRAAYLRGKVEAPIARAYGLSEADMNTLDG